jgi:Photosynthetic reaction centre protein/GIY-YIG catalytic domain
MGREWELSFRLGMRPWIAVAYSAPVAAASAVFLVYPIGQGSFSDGYEISVAQHAYYCYYFIAIYMNFYIILKNKNWSNPTFEFYLKGEHPNLLLYFSKSFIPKKNIIQVNSTSNRSSSIEPPDGGPPSGEPDGEEDNKRKDNPLLNNNSKIISGERIPFAEFSLNNIKNKSAVYFIFCKKTGKYAVGESKNFKKRSKQHFDNLKNNKHSNNELQKDFNLYGMEEFEFIIHETPIDDRVVRVEKQNELIKLLNAQNISYTSGLSETLTPRFEGKYPSSAGVFFFYCKTTDRSFFGHTAQTLGIGGRVRSMIAGLNKNEFSGSAQLQQDWLKYGEQDFDIVVYAYGSKYADIKERIQIINALINEKCNKHPKGKLSVYNTHYAGYDNQIVPIGSPIDPDLICQLPPMQPYEPTRADNTGLTIKPPLDVLPNNPKGYKPIFLADRKPICINEVVYLSVQEAAKAYEVNWNVINKKVIGPNPDHRFATEKEIENELVRRGWSTDPSLAIKPKQENAVSKTTKGVDKSIVVERMLFPTMAAAARHYGVTPNSVKKWPGTGHKNSFFPNDQPNGIHPNKDWNPPTE